MRRFLLVVALLCAAPIMASALTMRAWGQYSFDGDWPNLQPPGLGAFSISFDHRFEISDAEIEAGRSRPVALPVTGDIKIGETTFKDALWLSLGTRFGGIAAFITARPNTPVFGEDDFQLSALFGRRGKFADLRDKKQSAPLRDFVFLTKTPQSFQQVQGLGIIRFEPAADATPVPLPASGWLLAGAAILGGALKRRKRA